MSSFTKFSDDFRHSSTASQPWLPAEAGEIVSEQSKPFIR